MFIYYDFFDIRIKDKKLFVEQSQKSWKKRAIKLAQKQLSSVHLGVERKISGIIPNEFIFFS